MFGGPYGPDRRTKTRWHARPCIGPSLTRLRTIQRANPAELRSHRRSRRKYIVIALLIILAGFGAATARLFVWPEQGMPSRVDAIVMLNGSGDRLDTALHPVRAHRAPMFVISLGSPCWYTSVCAAKIPGVKVICFIPHPRTTRGEAEFAGLLAKRYRWHSIVLVTTTPQSTRARLRVGRCVSGQIYLMGAPLPLSQWPQAIAYEWGATIKALVLQRSC